MLGQYCASISGLQKVSRKRCQLLMRHRISWATNALVRLWRGALKMAVGRSLLDDAAVVHEDDAVGSLAGKAQLVANDQHGHAARLEVTHDGQHRANQLRIERRRRLVEQHDLGIKGERTGDGDALLLAARQLAGIAAGLVRQADAGKGAATELVGIGAQTS